MASTLFKSPEPFEPGQNNPAAAWKEYREAFKIYAKAAKLNTESAETQVATFLYILGPAGRKIYDNLVIQIPAQGTLTLQLIYDALDRYYEPYKSLATFQYSYFTTKQGAQEPFEDFLTSLKTQARNCEFGTIANQLLCTQIIIGISKDSLRKTLLAKRNITAEEAIAICQADESSTMHADLISRNNGSQSTPTLTSQTDALRQSRRPHGTQQPAYHHNPRNNTRSHQNQPPHPARVPYAPTHGNRQQYRPQNRYVQGSTNIGNRSSACRNCGTIHASGASCPARNAQCYNCSRRGHWAGQCRSAQTLNEMVMEPMAHIPYEEQHYYAPQNRHHQEVDDRHGYTATYDFAIDILTLQCNVTMTQVDTLDEWFDIIWFDKLPVLMKIDTGSQVNILPQHLYNALSNPPPLQPPVHIVRSYSGHPVEITGAASIPCSSHLVSTTLPFFITPRQTAPILGARASTKLGLVTRNTTRRDLHPRNADRSIPSSWTEEPTTSTVKPRPPSHVNALDLTETTTPADIVNHYQDVFDTVGKLPGLHTIRLKSTATPTICSARKIPFALRNKVYKELQRMIQLGVIAPVTEPTDWVHPMVVVPKPDPKGNREKDGVRICLDPRKLNEALQKEHYPMPTAQEIYASLHGSKIFTVLDAQSAFWHVELEEKSSYLCTFATPFGRFRFLRLPYGLASASEIFQRTMHEIYPPAQFPNIQISTDDILINDKHARNHNASLITVFERARQNNLKFSRKKMQLATNKIQYLGHILSSTGLEIAPSKVAAIHAIPSPTDKKALQRFLGMVNYLAKFLPQHSTITSSLRDLLKKDSVYTWDANAETTFRQLKTLISTAPILAYYDPQAKITLSVDSSSVGVGAALLQNGKPVEYASTSFTSTQQNYAPIERELLGIVYACERFHYFIIGTNFMVQTDHKPLISIVKKPMHLLSPRIQRLVLRLFRYQLTLIYVPGKNLQIADTLSRAPCAEMTIDTSSLEGPHVVLHSVTALSEEKRKAFIEAIKTDNVSQMILSYIRKGWPSSFHKLNAELKPFWPDQQEIHEHDGLIYRGDRLFIPAAVRQDVMEKIHSAHQGISACLARAKLHVYWPQMTVEITGHIQRCDTCRRKDRANTSLPLQPHAIPQLPWATVGTDLFHMNNKNFIILVDYYSKYVEAQELRSTNTEAIINFLIPHFARHGVPQKLVSDNGPPFNSATFKEFLQHWGVEHKTSSPYHPKSNGMTERTIQTIKHLMSKAKRGSLELQNILMEYRTTPIGKLPSPAEMLMGRRIRTPLTTTQKILQPHFPTKHIEQTLHDRQQTMLSNQKTKKATPLDETKAGSTVYYQAGPRQWLPATIVGKAPEPDSYILRTDTNATIRRTLHQLRPNKDIKRKAEHEAELDKRISNDKFRADTSYQKGRLRAREWARQPKPRPKQALAETIRTRTSVTRALAMIPNTTPPFPRNQTPSTTPPFPRNQAPSTTPPSPRNQATILSRVMPNNIPPFTTTVTPTNRHSTRNTRPPRRYPDV